MINVVRTSLKSYKLYPVMPVKKTQSMWKQKKKFSMSAIILIHIRKTMDFHSICKFNINIIKLHIRLTDR